MRSTKEIINWIKEFRQSRRKLLIAGPCSAESSDQIEIIATKLSQISEVSLIRAGIWKPRTFPGSFSGLGVDALPWIANAQKKFNIPFTCEVANREHVNQALKHGIEIFWIGARTTGNPFSVQEIVETLVMNDRRDVIIMIKNSINCDFDLWSGAIERFKEKGINNLIAIHRGFTAFKKSRYRNQPYWRIPFQIKSKYPEIPLLCDPSHIAGKSELILEVLQKAVDLDFDGFMIECHPVPYLALSDPKQQVTPEELINLLHNIQKKTELAQGQLISQEIRNLRNQIDLIDNELIESLSLRMSVAKKIGDIKSKNKMTILQKERFQKMIGSRITVGNNHKLNDHFIMELFQIIHEESVRGQGILE